MFMEGLLYMTRLKRSRAHYKAGEVLPIGIRPPAASPLPHESER